MNVGRRRGCGGRVTLGGNGVGSGCRAADLYPFREGDLDDLTGSGRARRRPGRKASPAWVHTAAGVDAPRRLRGRPSGLMRPAGVSSGRLWPAAASGTALIRPGLFRDLP